MQFLNQFFFDIYPYLAGAVFLIGSWLRYDYGQYSWRAGSSQMLDKRACGWRPTCFTSALSASSRATSRHADAALDV